MSGDHRRYGGFPLPAAIAQLRFGQFARVLHLIQGLLDRLTGVRPAQPLMHSTDDAAAGTGSGRSVVF